MCKYVLFSTCFLVFSLHVSECVLTTCEPILSVDPDPVVRVSNFGSFRGSATVSLWKNRTIYQYLGIPYALPPMGNLRFKAPIRLKKLNPSFTYDAKYFKPKCPQLVTDEDFSYLKANEGIAEDCLYINVFTPTKTKGKPLLPVLVFIHGGGYYQNSAAEFCPNYLLDHDIILVTLQYRLGPLGFLNLETEDIAGNMGLLDTLEALEWISANIVYFGGDNNRITICGQSSGGVSVSLLMVSPLVRPGLFQQVIAQSGNFLGDWSLDRNSKEHALEFARYVNCTQSDINELTQCLKSVSSFQLIKANMAYMNDRIIATKNAVKEIGIAHAVIQKNGTRKFLNEDPEESLKNGRFLKLPMMTGVTKDEGSLILEPFVDYIVDPTMKNLQLDSHNESIYFNGEFFNDFLRFIGMTENIHRFELLRDSYLPEEKSNTLSQTIPSLVDLGSAIFMKTIVLDFARRMRQFAPTYLYTFDYKGRKTKLGYGKQVKHSYFNGVAHSDDLLYLYPYYLDPSLNEEEKEVVAYITNLWANFIINGKKFIATTQLQKWPTMNNSVGPYLKINHTLQIRSNFLKEYRSNIDRSINSFSASSKPMFTNSLLLLLFFFTISKLA